LNCALKLQIATVGAERFWRRGILHLEQRLDKDVALTGSCEFPDGTIASGFEADP